MRAAVESAKGREHQGTRKMASPPIRTGRYRRRDAEELVDPPRLHLVQAYLRTIGAPKA
jgi:hypothetical protein